MPPSTYSALIARNLRVARAAASLQQEHVAERMRDLGYPAWQRSTVSQAERGKRRVSAEELAALALCLGTLPEKLFDPSGVPVVALPSGLAVPARRFRIPDPAFRWVSNHAVIDEPTDRQRSLRERADLIQRDTARSREELADMSFDVDAAELL